MSYHFYDLVVFEPTAAPKERAAFMTWYQLQIQWPENHSYDDPQVASSALQCWFHDMIQFFPPLNGPLASAEGGQKVTVHCVGRDIIYSSFMRPVAREARAKMRELAIKHNVGFVDFNIKDGEILFPGCGPLPLEKKSWRKFLRLKIF